MSKQKIVLFLCLFFVCQFSSKVFSQIVASATTGCVPFSVNFTAPPGAISGSWNLGNGSSSQLNPTTLYYNAGTYNVSFTGTGAGGNPVTGNITIVAIANNIVPSINFTIPQNHCAPMPVLFSGSTSGGGTQFQWTFGDGGVASGTNVTHPYTLGGVFIATLSVTDPATGCEGTAAAGPINVSLPPNVIIDANPGLTSCIVPFTTSFTGSNSASGSPLGSSLTYNWSFTGGSPAASTATTPGNVTFNTQGIYNVSLVVTDNNFCSNSNTVVVTVVQPTISATTPASICIAGQQTVTGCPAPCFGVSYSSNLPNVFVQMDDGNSFTLPMAVGSFTYARYTTPGPKTITLTASAGSCSASIVKTIFVEQIVPEYTFTPASYTCSPTMPVSFINQTTVNTNSSLSYTWMVEHWSRIAANVYSSTAVNPNITIEQQSANPYTWFGVYIPRVKLEVMSSLGCYVYIFDVHRFDSIRRPTAWFNKDKKQGCAPLTVRFRDSSNTNTSIYPIQSYTWNNGANPATVVSGNVPPAMNNATFTYPSPGTYTPYLVIQTAGGCIDTSYIDTVVVVNQPTVSAVFSSQQVCAGMPLQINMSAAPSSSLIQHWHAQSDDGFFSGCINDSMPVWHFTNLGERTFTISAYDHSCKSEIVASETVAVLGPVVRGKFQTSCITPKEVKFFSDLRGAESATLSFGDNTASHIILGNPTGTVSDVVTHTYNANGDYTATLKGSNSLTGCGPFTQTMLVTVRGIQASLTVQPYICRGAGVTYSALGSVDVYTTCSRGYAWFIDTLEVLQTSSPLLSTCTMTNSDPYCLFTPGIHTITLWVRNINGCTDTATRTFILDTPQPSFTVSSNPYCMSSMPIQLVNTTPQSPIAANSFTWDFGTIPGTSTLATSPVTQWPTYNYTATIPSQTYTISLTSQSDLFGCRESFTMALQVNKPPTPYMYAFTPLACTNNTVSFNVDALATSSVNGVLAVNYGDGSPPVTPPTTGVIAHTYTNSGIYTYTISFTDPAGCAASFTQQVSVQSAPAAADFIYVSNDIPPKYGPTFCAPVTITFSNTSVSTYSLNYYWDLNTGSPIVDESEVAQHYDDPGVQTVTLMVATYPNGCTATITHSFTVLRPKARLVIDKTKLCLGEPIQLHIADSSGVTGWAWFYGDGVSSGTILANSSPATQTVYPYTFYPPPFGSTTVSLQYFAMASSVPCPDFSNVAILVTKLEADFNRNDELAIKDSVHCLNVSDLFSNKSKINNSSFINGLYFDWNFGNGVTSSSMSPGYTYPTAGVYTVTLKVTDPQAGCVDLSVKHMTINPLPTVGIALPDSVCSGSEFILVANPSSDVSQYQWQPTEGVASPNSMTTAVTSTISTTYSVFVTSIHGCKAVSNGEYVFVQRPTTVINWDTTVVIGQVTPMNVNFGPTYTYTWSPAQNLSCDHCPYATSSSTANITYTVEVEDNMGCFRTAHTFSVYVDPITSIDVPTAFTPNGDGVNDVIYVDGWGIKKLIYFRIFNRWGQLLFESYDIHVGWDGTYKGVPQNMETYIYQASAEGYVPGTILEKTSSFRLIR